MMSNWCQVLKWVEFFSHKNHTINLLNYVLPVTIGLTKALSTTRTSIMFGGHPYSICCLSPPHNSDTIERYFKNMVNSLGQLAWLIDWVSVGSAE